MFAFTVVTVITLQWAIIYFKGRNYTVCFGASGLRRANGNAAIWLVSIMASINLRLEACIGYDLSYKNLLSWSSHFFIYIGGPEKDRLTKT